MERDFGPDDWLLLFGGLADSEDEEAEEARHAEEQDDAWQDASPNDMGWDDEPDEEDPNEGIWQP